VRAYPWLWPRIYAYLRTLILPISEVEKALPATGNILDVGCGYGVTTAYFALKSTDRTVFGSELVDKRVSTAREVFKNIPNSRFEVNNLLDDHGETFDAIIAIDLLHHINGPEKENFFNSCRKRLCVNGLLIIKDIDKTPIHKYYINYLHDTLFTRFSKLYFISAIDMRNMIERSGFQTIDQKPLKSLFYPHVIYVCKKIKDE